LIKKNSQHYGKNKNFSNRLGVETGEIGKGSYGKLTWEGKKMTFGELSFRYGCRYRKMDNFPE